MKAKDPVDTMPYNEPNSGTNLEENEEGKAKSSKNGIGNSCKKSEKTELKELSKDDFVQLLGIMEGEVQAREDIIHLLRSKQVPNDVLEAHYASAGHVKALQALHRDGLLAGSTKVEEDVYQRPMAELDRLEDKHRETYSRMLGQLLLAEKCHRRTVYELETEKRKHVDYMVKSDDFTNLLEQERERLKHLLEQEKAYQSRKDKEHNRRLEKVRQELIKLKSFALMLVDERQLHIEQIDQHNQKVQELNEKILEREKKLSELSGQAKEDAQKVLKLEGELELKAAKIVQDHEDMSTKFSNQESQNRQLRLKLAGLSRQIDELEESKKALQKSEEELQEMRDKISKGECGNSSLMAELETLRKKVMEMEGKDDEITKTESQCRELRNKLLDEENHSKELKLEVEKLQKRMVELEKLEMAFNASKLDCTQLHASLEQEKNLTKNLMAELEIVKNHVKELESSELRLEKAEMGLKDDLTKLKSFTVIMVEERKNLAERIRQQEKNSDNLNRMVETEQGKVMEVTEKLIEERKRLLKLKSEMEIKMSSLTQEKDLLRSNLGSEEVKCQHLAEKVCLMQKQLEEFEAESKTKKDMIGDSELSGQSHSRVLELTLEIQSLKHRLKQLEVVEGDLMKTEDEYDLLQKKFRTEQDKANILSQQLEEMKSQIERNKAIEKGELVIHESELRQRCKIEESKTKDLQAEVQVLKEKIHELMNKEDQLSQLQVDYSMLQQRFLEEEKKIDSMSHDVLNLTKELEATKRYSRALRPSMNGRRMVDVPLSSTGVQTDALTSEISEEDTPAVFIRKSVQEENHIMNNLRQKVLKKPNERPALLERYSPLTSEINLRKSWIPWMKKKDVPEKSNTNISEQQRTEMAASTNQGQPLHIRVTPDHENSTATLHITSPNAKDFFSSTTVIPTLGLQKPRITIIPSTLTTISPMHKESKSAVGPERAKSPVSITTISRAKCPEEKKPTLADRPTSPVPILTVTTSSRPDLSSSPESREMTMGRAVFRVTPEKQTVPLPIKKYNSNIITTEDNKIHIHLGSQLKRPQEASDSTITVKPGTTTSEIRDVSTGTVLRSPRYNTATKGTASKVMSTIMITPITSAPTRQTQPTDVQCQRTVPTTRIPMSKGMKTGKVSIGAAGGSGSMKLESRAESQLMKIELKKSAVSSNSGLPTGGKG